MVYFASSSMSRTMRSTCERSPENAARSRRALDREMPRVGYVGFRRVPIWPWPDVAAPGRYLVLSGLGTAMEPIIYQCPLQKTLETAYPHASTQKSDTTS